MYCDLIVLYISKIRVADIENYILFIDIIDRREACPAYLQVGRLARHSNRYRSSEQPEKHFAGC
jgi:hypothetical protein